MMQYWQTTCGEHALPVIWENFGMFLLLVLLMQLHDPTYPQGCFNLDISSATTADTELPNNLQ